MWQRPAQSSERAPESDLDLDEELDVCSERVGRRYPLGAYRWHQSSNLILILILTLILILIRAHRSCAYVTRRGQSVRKLPPSQIGRLRLQTWRPSGKRNGQGDFATDRTECGDSARRRKQLACFILFRLAHSIDLHLDCVSDDELRVGKIAIMICVRALRAFVLGERHTFAGSFVFALRSTALPA